ncbi:MAG: hypothetical protein ABJK28_10555 [Algibacter sp.]
MNTLSSLQEKIDNVKELDFGDILSRTFDLFKKTWLQGFIMVLLIMVVMIPFIVVVFMPTYSSVLEQVQSGNYDPNDGSSLLQGQTDSFRYMILGLTFFISFVTTGLTAGFYRIVKRIDFNESYGFSDFFYFYKAKNLGKMFAIAAFSLLIALINFAFEKFLPPTAASLINMFISIFFSVFTALFVIIFAFNSHLESSDFFTLGFKLGLKKWGLIFGLMVVAGIIGALGAIACFIGMFFTISIMYLPTYLVYKDIFGFDNVSVIDQIGIE